MADVISCPQCQRRLNLPDECRGQDVRCPSCRTTFSSLPMAAPVEEEIPFVIPVEVPAGWDGAEVSPPLALDPSRRTRRKKAGSSGWAVALAVIVMIGGGLTVFAGILFMIDSDRPPPAPSRPPFFADDTAERQAALAAFHAQAPVPEDQVMAEVRPVLDTLRNLRFDIRRAGDSFDADRPTSWSPSTCWPSRGHARAFGPRRAGTPPRHPAIPEGTPLSWEDFQVRASRSSKARTGGHHSPPSARTHGHLKLRLVGQQAFRKLEGLRRRGPRHGHADVTLAAAGVRAAPASGDARVMGRVFERRPPSTAQRR